MTQGPIDRINQNVAPNGLNRITPRGDGAMVGTLQYNAFPINLAIKREDTVEPHHFLDCPPSGKDAGIVGAPNYLLHCTYTRYFPSSLALAHEKYCYVDTRLFVGASKPLRWDFHNCLEGQCGKETDNFL